MIEGLIETDNKIILELFPKLGENSFDIGYNIGISQTYAITRLKTLNNKGFVIRSKRGRTVMWAINPKTKKLLARHFKIPWKEVKAQTKEQHEKEFGKAFAWGN